MLEPAVTNPITVEVWGLEPQTYGLQSHRSSHLSYTPGHQTRLVIISEVAPHCQTMEVSANASALL